MNAAPRETIRSARAALDVAELQLTPRARAWRQRSGGPSLGVLVGCGLAAGFFLSALPSRFWSRAGAGVFGAGAALARSPLGPVLFATLWTSVLAPLKAPQSATGSATSTRP